MKKLCIFDSLKLVVAIACIFILNAAHADTAAIQSVIAYGKTEQNGTPTPTNPVPIMTNNGELRVSPNLFDINNMQILGRAYTVTKNGNNIVATAQADTVTASRVDFFIPVSVFKPNTTYYLRTKSNVALTGNQCNIGKATQQSSTGNAYYASLRTKENGGWSGAFTITDIDPNQEYVSFFYYLGAQTEGTVITISDIMITEGSTATTGVYANGLTETMRDSAGLKATAEMLLSVGDYKDEQNITTGTITRRVGVKVLDGTEDWTIASGVFRYDMDYPAALPNTAICTHFKGIISTKGMSSMSDLSVKVGYSSGPGRLYIKYTAKSTTDDLKAYLAEQYANGTPVIVVYPLAEPTTESVTAQSLTTAPVRQTMGAIMGMPIKTILTDNSEIMSGAETLIKIATTKYNEESFSDVQGALSGVFNAVDTVVTQTMDQAQAIDTIATSKQTRPNEGCMAKYCLLVEDEDGTPHWYPIAGANGVTHNLPDGYTELQYIESTGTQWIDTGVSGNCSVSAIAQQTENTGQSQVLFGTTSSGRGGTYFGTSSAGINWGLGAYESTGLSDVLASTKTTMEINFNTNGADGTVDNESISRITTVSHDKLAIFATPDGNYAGRYRLWSTKVYKNNTLVRDFIPVRRNSNSAVGMYDLVSGNFFTNSGTGTFIAGPDM